MEGMLTVPNAVRLPPPRPGVHARRPVAPTPAIAAYACSTWAPCLVSCASAPKCDPSDTSIMDVEWRLALFRAVRAARLLLLLLLLLLLSRLLLLRMMEMLVFVLLAVVLAARC